MSTSASYFLPGPSSGSAVGIPRVRPKPRRWIHHGDENHFAGDYVVEFGEIKQDYGFTSKVVLVLRTRLGSAQCAPWFGSRLHEIQTADERGRRLAESFTLMAIQHLREEILDLVVTASIDKERAPGRIDIVVSGRRGMTELQAPYSLTISARRVAA